MASYRPHSFAAFLLWFGGIWLLARHLGLQSDSTLLLCGEIIGFWILLNVLFICSRTILKRHYSPFNALPGPKSINWLYDHVFDVFDEPLALNVSKWINDRVYPQGLLHFFGLFGSSYIVPTSPEALTEVLSTRAYDYEKTISFKRYTTRFWGHGLVSQEQKEHKRHRKSYLPVFNQANVKRLKATLSGKSSQLVDQISKLCSEGDDLHTANPKSTVIPICSIIAMVSLDITGIIALGVDFETILGKNHEIFQAYEMLFTSTNEKRTLFMLYNLAPQWVLSLLPFPVAEKMDEARKLLANVCRQIIQGRLKQLERREAESQPLDFLTNLVLSDFFDEDAAIAQIVVILGAGYESTGGTLAWVIYCLAAYPEAQEELRKELTTIGVFHESLEGSNYDKLPILNAVIMEATRLYPAFTFLLRKAIRDTMIGDQIIPRGTLVGMCPEAINCAQHLWGPDAANFLPERWIDRSDPACPRPNPLGGASAPICMLSFGYGARSCVGRELALAQMKCQIAMIVQRFHVGLVDDSKPGPSGLFATSPPSDLQIHFTELHV